MLNRVISIGFLAFFAVSSAIFFVIAVLIWICTIQFDRRLVVLHMFTSFWASVYLWVMPAWSVSTRGREKIKRGRTYVVVSNHQSQLDILVAFRLFFRFKWVSKAEVFKLPFIGWNMVLNRYIKLKRGDRESVAQMMAECEKALSNGSSVYFFPEGTRSSTGLVKEFKAGAFILAQKMKLPILPIVINGTKDALPKHSLNFHGRHPIFIEVLDEIPFESFANLSPEETAERVRKIIADRVMQTIRRPGSGRNF
ncbi:MAG: lysophospholipid acyltransferase family protein [Pseudomonadota bacterium]